MMMTMKVVMMVKTETEARGGGFVLFLRHTMARGG
jgi:hypothetical protein